MQIQPILQLKWIHSYQVWATVKRRFWLLLFNIILRRNLGEFLGEMLGDNLGEMEGDLRAALGFSCPSKFPLMIFTKASFNKGCGRNSFLGSDEVTTSWLVACAAIILQKISQRDLLQQSTSRMIKDALVIIPRANQNT